MSSDFRDPEADGRHPRIRVWRYDQDYGADRYARTSEPHRRHRSRRRGPLRWLRRGPQAELVDMLSLLVRRHPIPTVLLAGAGLWLGWPALQGSRSAGSALPAGAPDVISVFVEDPQRTLAAVDLWRARPGSLLVLQGRPASLADSLQALRDRGGSIEGGKGGVVSLTRGCDTVGQLTSLAGFLSRQPRPGRLTVVTGPAHLERSLAIARIVVGSGGWQVEGIPAATGDNRPESAWRLWRDQARAQVWRLTGWDGTGDGSACRARERGLG